MPGRAGLPFCEAYAEIRSCPPPAYAHTGRACTARHGWTARELARCAAVAGHLISPLDSRSANLNRAICARLWLTSAVVCNVLSQGGSPRSTVTCQRGARLLLMGDDFGEVGLMNVIRRRGWEIPGSNATPEHLVFNRRNFLAGGASALALASYPASGQRVSDLTNLPDPTSNLYPAKRNEKYVLDRPVTDENINAHYNNFYEFNSSKEVAAQAQLLPI